MNSVTNCSDFGATKIKSTIVSIVSPSICHEVMEPDAMIFIFFNAEFQASVFTLVFHPHQEAF